jgi:hypothetical protein
MRRRLLAVLSVGAMVAALAAGVAPATGASASAPRLRHLDPGGPARYREKVPVNLVLVGYERDQVQQRRLLAGLPSSYRPVVRSRLFYGVTERLGIRYTYDYDVTYASSRYEDRFFSTFSRLARPAPLTTLQQQYNDQQGNVLEVTENHHIDAPTVERCWPTTRRPASTPAATRSSSSTGTGGRTSSSTSTPRPTSPTRTPASTSASRPRAAS